MLSLGGLRLVSPDKDMFSWFIDFLSSSVDESMLLLRLLRLKLFAVFSLVKVLAGTLGATPACFVSDDECCFIRDRSLGEPWRSLSIRFWWR
jgi:hypothetical protein